MCSSMDWFKGKNDRKVPWSSWENLAGFRWRFSLQPIDARRLWRQKAMSCPVKHRGMALSERRVHPILKKSMINKIWWIILNITSIMSLLFIVLWLKHVIYSNEFFFGASAHDYYITLMYNMMNTREWINMIKHIYHMVPPSYKLLYKPYKYRQYRYINHKPEWNWS